MTAGPDAVPEILNVPDVTNAGDADALREVVRAIERFPSLFALGKDAVGLYGLDGKVIVGNDASRALIGEEFSAFHTGRHLAPGELERAEACFERAASGEPAEFEAALIHCDGEKVHVVVRLVPALVDGKLVGVFARARDITLRRRAESSRDESRQEFGSLFEQHPDSISMIDANGRYTKINAAAEQMVQYRSEEVAGWKAGDVMHAAGERESLDRFVHDTIAAAVPVRYQGAFERRDGVRTLLDGTAIPIVVDEKVTGVFLLSRDVTERARIAETLALAARRTRALYRLASEIGAHADDRAGSAMEYGLKELGFETAFAVFVTGGVPTLERAVGVPLPIETGDPVFSALFRDAAAGSALLELDEAALGQRAAEAGAEHAFCRSFVGVPLGSHDGRCGALGFASRSATAPLTDFDREFVRAVAKLAALSIKRALDDEQLQGLAHNDALTGLPNRALLSDRFKQAIATAQRRREQIAVYFVDIDKFKDINDTHGHHVGDEVLRAVASRLLAGCRASDTVARLGGDEFIVLRTGPSTGDEPQALAERLRAELEAPCEIEGLRVNLSVGIGISVFPCDGNDEAALLESADVALYAAKACGKGAIRRFEGRTPSAAELAATLERRARAAAAERVEPPPLEPPR